MFQFTRPRGARPPKPLRFEDEAVVSIHAPARGATASPAAQASSLLSFQFTRPRGARQVPCARLHVGQFVSIHAPARGATRMYWRSQKKPAVSIHAPARGATKFLVPYSPQRKFQFTRPRGARRYFFNGGQDSAHRFNSRAREGRDSGTFDAGISLLLQGGIRGARCK